MKAKKTYFLYYFTCLIVLLFSNLTLYSQLPVVDGSSLVYTRVDNFWAEFDNNTDTLQVADPSGFAIGDTVLFHHTISGYPYGPGPQIGEIRTIRNAGIYAIYLIDTIDGNLIVLNNSLPAFGSSAHESGEYAQLIKIPTYDRARLTSSFSFPSWNSTTKTGGIFPLLVNKKLVLEADFRADGKGFNGGVVNGDYITSGGACSDGVFGPDDNYFTSSAVDSAAYKGESFGNLTVNLVGLTRGKGLLGTAGGGGNAKYSGGGGGANGGQGGKGGYESDECTTPGDMGGIGGHYINYSTDPVNAYGNRVEMGGGGGAGTQSPDNSRIGTSGGNGGGIIILICDTLEAVGTRTISVNGASVTDTASAGAGGGGGGGCLVIDVNNYIGDFVLEAKGGNGGNIKASPDITGPGGGGGGGVIQYRDASLPANVSSNRNNGIAGVVTGTTNNNYASNGGLGKRQSDLLIPIRGFILNIAPDDQVVCEDVLPAKLNAPVARGGSGTYTYKWLYSTDTTNWLAAPGTNNEATYQPDYLSDTTFFRRYVEDLVNPAIYDSGYYMTIFVQPKIENNLIISDDTVCYNLAPQDALTSLLSLTGGDGNGFSYTWESSADNISYSSAPGTNDGFSYNVGALTDTAYFRRKVESGVCASYSDTVTITVLASLTDLLITEDQILCNNQDAETLNGNEPGGGQPGDKRYEWWQTVSGVRTMVATTEDYTPLALPAENYEFKRIVYSGFDDACIDSSNAVNVLVYPDIAGNSFSVPDDTICAELPTVQLTGSTPSGGKINDYEFYWEKSPNGSDSWIDGGTSPHLKDLQPGTLNSTSYFRRTVYSSSTDSACIDISPVLKIEVLPALVNTLTSPDDTICQFTSSPQINGNTASGGLTGDYEYLWEYRKDDTNWATASGINNDVNFSPGILDDTSFYYFRRVVTSGPSNTCTDISDSVTMFILPSIKNNGFGQPSGYEICFGTEVTIDGLGVSGGDGSYEYFWEDSTYTSGSWQIISSSDVEDYTKNNLFVPTWFRRTVVSGECSDLSDVVFADTLALPVLYNLSSVFDTICHDQDNYYLKLEITSAEGSPVDYTVIYNDGVNSDAQSILEFNTDSINITGFNPFTAYTYSIQSITDVNGCQAVDGLDKSIDLWVNQAPDPGIIKPSSPYKICGTDFDLVSDPDLNTGVSDGWWTVDDDLLHITDSMASTGIFNLSISDFDSTDIKVMFTQNTKACGARSDTLLIKLYEQPEQPGITQGDSVVIFITDQVILNGEIPTSGFVSWSSTDHDLEITDNGFESIIGNIPINENTIVKYTVRNGVCNVMDDEVLIIRKEVHVYDGISPSNADNMNDYLIAEGLDVDGLSFKFQLFSTNGMMVRQLDQDDLDRLGFDKGLPNNGRVLWDGKTKYEQDYVPAGTYYYVLIIEFKGREFVDKGFVVVKE